MESQKEQNIIEQQWVELKTVKKSPRQLKEQTNKDKINEQSQPNPQKIQEGEPNSSNKKLVNKRQSHRLQKTKFPQMKVACTHCKHNQSVSGIRTSFRCKHCQERSLCEPLYGVMICLGCQKKILYMKVLSKGVRCTNCSEINGLNEWQGEEDDEDEEMEK